MIELRSKGDLTWEDDAPVSALGWSVFAPKLILQICMKFSTTPVRIRLTCTVNPLRKYFCPGLFFRFFSVLGFKVKINLGSQEITL